MEVIRSNLQAMFLEYLGLYSLLVTWTRVWWHPPLVSHLRGTWPAQQSRYHRHSRQSCLGRRLLSGSPPPPAGGRGTPGVKGQCWGVGSAECSMCVRVHAYNSYNHMTRGPLWQLDMIVHDSLVPRHSPHAQMYCKQRKGESGLRTTWSHIYVTKLLSCW